MTLGSLLQQWYEGRDRRFEYVLLVFVALLLLAGFGMRDPWPSDEPRFVLVAKQMWESGDWLHPMRGGELYPDKPPMFMWLLALSYGITGSWTLAFLLPSLVAGAITLFLTYQLTRRLYGVKAARLATLLLASTLQFGFYSKRAQIDAVLLAMMTASVYAFARALLTDSHERASGRFAHGGWLLLGAFLSGLATVTKGVGALTLLMLPCWLYARRSLPIVERTQLLVLPVLAGFLLGVSVWLAPLLLDLWLNGNALKEAYVREILLGQTARRYLNPGHHHKPIWYFAEVMALSWLPLSLFALAAARAAFKKARFALRHLRLWLSFALVVLLFFTLTKAKRDVYILPMLPIVTLALAPMLPWLVQHLILNKVLRALTLLIGLVLLAYGVGGMQGAAFAQKLSVRLSFEPWLLLCVLGPAWMLCSLLRRGLWAFAFSVLATWSLLGWYGYPRQSDHSSSKALMQSVRAQIGADTELALIGWKEQHLLMSQGPTTVFGFLRNRAAQELDAVAWLKAKPGRKVLLQERNLEACFDRERAQPAGSSNRRHFYLVDASALLAQCKPHPDDAKRDSKVAEF
jgi:4-amino-4-deoxy-L-arabinose transferase-like glycosyltransferase